MYIPSRSVRHALSIPHPNCIRVSNCAGLLAPVGQVQHQGQATHALSGSDEPLQRFDLLLRRVEAEATDVQEITLDVRVGMKLVVHKHAHGRAEKLLLPLLPPHLPAST